jgi:translocation and assembly module TamB
MAEQDTNASRPADEQPVKPRPRRALRWVAGIFGALLLVLVAVVAAGWIWAGSAQSLAAALGRAARYLPAGQTLESRDVTGSLRSGGHIGWLRWQSPALSVEVQDATIGWQLAPLLHRKVSLGEIHAKNVVIEKRGPADESPTEPLQEITLPVDIDLPFRVDTIRWAGPPEVLVTQLAGHYRYQRGEHQLKIDGVEVAGGHYGLDATLQGAAPMALEATARGRLSAPLPEGATPLVVGAGVYARGNLSGLGARLRVAAAVQPADGATAPEGMHADVIATVAPWLKQPLLTADGKLRNLDLALLVPQAPATMLSGTVNAGPIATGWQASATLVNSLPGPYDQGKLPVEKADVQVSQRADGSWDISQALVRAGGGDITAQGHWGPQPATLPTTVGTPTPGAPAGTTPVTPAPAAPWEIIATLSGIQPGALHTQLAGPTLSGKATASQQGPNLDFDVALNTVGGKAAPRPRAARGSSPASTLETLQLLSAAAQGRWSDGTLDLRKLAVRTADATIDGVLQARPAERSGKGRLTAVLPGAQIDVDGAMAPASGAGRAHVALSNAASLQRWIATIPPLRSAIGAIALDGSATLDAQWRGGWESAVKRLQQGTGGPGELLLDAKLAAPKLDVVLAGTGQANTAIALKGVTAELSGTLGQASLSLQGSASTGGKADATSATLSTRASGGIDGPGRYHASVTELQLQAALANLPGPWNIKLQAPLTAQVRQGKDSLSVETSAGSASLTGPAPGSVGIAWQPVSLQSTGSGSAARLRLRSQGALKGLPMAWAEILAAGGQQSLAKLGFAGDLVFDGAWDVDAGDTLRARASLSRTSGDIRIQVPGAPPAPTVISTSGTGNGGESAKASATGLGNVATTAAGVIAARVEVSADGNDVKADLLWDSARAGVIKAGASTRLTHGAEGWGWAPDAPVAGSLDASLPQLGVWSVLAPPGWRVQGTFEAKAQLSGTRAAPRWAGNLNANGLAVRSVVDGIDLHDGLLRSTLNGDRLDITEFSLRGGNGPSTRIAGIAGSLATARTVATATDGGQLRGSGTLSWGKGIQMDIKAQAEALRVSVRTDRQVTLSGTVNARLNADGQLVLRGNLKTDRAVILLPDDTAPTLGSDVFVHSSAKDREAALAAQKAGTAPTAIGTAKAPDIVINFDLGNDFAVQGRGITTRLTGALEISSTAGLNVPPRVIGEIRTASGQYRAYSQQLDIESGVARFNGALDNPSLDILAIRPNISVRAGVQVTGTAQAPRVKLYSESGLTDAEILSWVVLGRSTANGGAEAALLQQAALALLSGGKGSSGNVAKKLGLDEIGFKGPGSGSDASAAALTFGKRLSQKLYVTYEHGLSGALGSLYIFYDLTRRLTLRGQAGVKSGLDLIYTLTYN